MPKKSTNRKLRSLEEVKRAIIGAFIRKHFGRKGHINSIDAEGNTPLWIAILTKNSYIACLLIEYGANFNVRREGFTFLTYVIAYQYEKVFFTLLKKGVNINEGNNCYTPLMYAACLDNLNIFMALLTSVSKDKINAKDIDGETVLMKAVRAKKSSNIASLINYGAKINSQSETGETALSLACSIGDIDSVQTLLECGIYYETLNIDISNYAGYTALMCAVISNNLEPAIIKMLCEAGANMNHVSNDGNNFIDLALLNVLSRKSFGFTNLFFIFEELKLSAFIDLDWFVCLLEFISDGQGDEQAEYEEAEYELDEYDQDE
jgi:ankyrin repeat protein